MFRQRVVILFPPVQRFVAKETCDVIGVVLLWIVEEAGFCKLDAR